MKVLITLRFGTDPAASRSKSLCIVIVPWGNSLWTQPPCHPLLYLQQRKSSARDFPWFVSETGEWKALKVLLWDRWEPLFLPLEGLLPAVEIKYMSLPCFPLNKSTAGCISSPCYLPDSDKWFDLFLQELALIWLIYKSPSYSFFLSLKNCTMLIFFSLSVAYPSSVGSQRWMLMVLW